MTRYGCVRVVTAAITTRVAQQRAALSPKTLILYFLLTTSSHAAEDTNANTTVTTLYPVTNKTHDGTTPPEKTTKKPYTTWNLDATYTASNLTDARDANRTESNEERMEKNESKEFRPSQHLGSFFDEEQAEIIKKPIVGPVKKPPSGFVSSPRDEYYFPNYNQLPKEIHQTYTEFPYKIESTIYTKGKGNWHFEDSIESKPTVEIPVKVPAGGLYQSPNAFKEKPLSEEEFALDIPEGGKEHPIKKRVNPWQSLLRVMTAFIPVGLIISALTPSVITIQGTAPDNQYPVNHFRRSETGLADIAPISERCRRRLLCELHSDRHYTNSPNALRRKKHCYKIHCEDTQALWGMLQWLLTYHQPAVDDQRARHIT